MILPALTNDDLITHVWTEALFTADTMAEHAKFFTQLIPLETAPKKHKKVEDFRALMEDI